MRELLRRWPKLTYFALGFLITAAVFWLPLYLVATVKNPPRWISIVMWIPQAVPWLAVIAILLVRAARGPAIHAGSFIGGVLLHWVLVASFLMFGDVAADHWHRRRFDAAEWRRNDQSNPSWPTRLTMVDDLLKRHDLHGLTRDSVEKLLGPRDNTTSWPEWDLVYYLGPERGLIRIDSETLVLKLGPDGRVRDYRIARD